MNELDFEWLLNEVYHLYIQNPGKFNFLAKFIADPFIPA